MIHVYRMFDERDRLLYIGKSIAWGTRMGQHQSRDWRSRRGRDTQREGGLSDERSA